MCTGKDASVTSEAETSIRPENALKIVGDNAVASMKATVAAMKKSYKSTFRAVCRCCICKRVGSDVRIFLAILVDVFV